MRSLLRRVTPVYALFVALTALQIVVLRVTGVTSHLTLGRLAPTIVLVALLGRRSRVAWWLLVALDAVPLLFSTFLLGPGVLWLHVVLFAGTSVALLGVLVSGPMRAYVAAGRPSRSLRPNGRALG